MVGVPHEGVRMKIRSVVAASCAAGLSGAVGLAALPAPPAQAFGTYTNLFGQHAEHEMITRTLGRDASDGRGFAISRFQPATLDKLAGATGSLGAVGAPDNPVDSSSIPVVGLGPAAKHCDDADYLAVAGYPRSRAQADKALDSCIHLYALQLDRAVVAAGKLVDSHNQLDVRQTDIRGCVFGWKPRPRQPARCEVLNGLGRALHLAEDFWSHSNWGDEAGAGAISTTNPPGLARTTVPDFFHFPNTAHYKIPLNLSTGCDDSVPLHGPSRCRGRVGHSVLAKDNGTIDPNSGIASDPTTYVRSSVGTNFQRAVTGARKQARWTWRDLAQQIKKEYGQMRGAKIVRAIVKDAPWSGCKRVGGSSRKALKAPAASSRGVRETKVQLVNRTGVNLRCQLALLDTGEWNTGVATTIAPGGSAHWQSVSILGTGTAGSVVFRFAGGPGKISWTNPLFGSNVSQCEVPKPFVCRQTGGSGHKATVRMEIVRG